MSVYNKVTINGTTYMDLSQDTVADASHIRLGYVGHLNDGTQVAGSYEGSGATLITKSITANGTYNASSDNADGYSSVTVAVPVLFKYIYTYTVTESWENNQTGITMAEAVMNGHYDADSLAYCMIFRNNGNTSGYRADAIVVGHMTAAGQSTQGWMYRNYYNAAVGTSSTARATQGTLIDLYVAKIPS